MRLFISHSSKNADLALRMVSALEAAKVRCWLAPRNIPPGSNYLEELVRAIEECAAVLLICTSEANDSVHVLRELELAMRFRKPILPVNVRGYQPVGGLSYALAGLQTITLEPEDITPAVAMLTALSRERGGPQLAPSLSVPAAANMKSILELSGIATEEATRLAAGLQSAIAACAKSTPAATFAMMHVFQRLPSMDIPERAPEIRRALDQWVRDTYVGDESAAQLLWPEQGQPFDIDAMDVVRRSFHNSRNVYAGGQKNAPKMRELVVDYCVRPGLRIVGPAHEPSGTVPAWVCVSMAK